MCEVQKDHLRLQTPKNDKFLFRITNSAYMEFQMFRKSVLIHDTSYFQGWTWCISEKPYRNKVNKLNYEKAYLFSHIDFVFMPEITFFFHNQTNITLIFFRNQTCNTEMPVFIFSRKLGYYKLKSKQLYAEISNEHQRFFSHNYEI